MKNPFISFFNDLRRKEFIPLKTVEFTAQAARSTLFPFLSIYARSIGITVSQYGIISIIVPILCLPLPTLAGMLADKIGNFKWFVSVTFFLSGIAGLLYLAVPLMESREKALVEFRCSMTDPLFKRKEYSQIFSARDNEVINTQCNYDCILISEASPLLNSSENVCRISKNCQSNIQSSDAIINQSDASENYVIETVAYILNSTYYLVDADDCADDFVIRNIDSKKSGSSCWTPCEGDLGASYNLTQEVITNYNIITVYAIFRILNAVLLASSLPLMISAVVAVLRTKNGDLGYQVIWGKIGAIIFTPIAGALIDQFSTDENENYSPIFYTYFLLSILGAISITMVDLEFKTPSNAVMAEVKELVKNPEAILLFTMCIILGMAFGVLDTYLFWLLEDLGADKSLMGMTVTVGAVSGIFIFFFSTEIIKKFGCSNCISFAIVIFAIRFYGCSVITNPWYAMPFEALECFTMSLLSVSVMTNASAISTITTMATIQSIMMSALYGAGRGVGSLVGGFMIDTIGIQRTFQMMSLVCAVTFTIYTLISTLFIKRKITSLKRVEPISDLENSAKDSSAIET